MVDKSAPPASTPIPPPDVNGVAAPSAAPAVVAPRRGPGHRGADMRDTVAEMAERAQLISQEAGTKVAAAMRDVISAAAGISGFAIESARDLVQYMIKRGQMTPEEADKLMREAEAAHDKRSPGEKSRPTATKIAAEKAAVAKAEAAARAAAQAAAMPPFRPVARPVVPPPVAEPPAPVPAPAKPAPTRSADRSNGGAAKPKAKTAAKPAAKTVAKATKPAAKSAAKPAKPAAKKGKK